MNFVNIRRIVGAGVLGMGALAMAVPAEATVSHHTSFIQSRNTVGDSTDGPFGDVNNTVCAITTMRSGDSTSLQSSCALGNFGGQWKLMTSVHNSGASVTCGINCYK